MIAIKLKTSRITNVKIPISSQNQGSFCFNLLFFFCFLKTTQREKCLNLEFFLVRISCIQSKYRKIPTTKHSIFGYFSRSASQFFKVSS